jgi:hypothetical protein
LLVSRPNACTRLFSWDVPQEVPIHAIGAEHCILGSDMGQTDSHLQEGTFMTRAELQTNQEYMWQALFGEQLTTLTLAVEMLLRCHLSPEEILSKTITALEGSQQDA